MVPEFFDRLRWLLLLWVGKCPDLTEIGIHNGDRASHVFDCIAGASREIAATQKFIMTAGLPSKKDEVTNFLDRYERYREQYMANYTVKAEQSISSCFWWLPLGDDYEQQVPYSTHQKVFCRLVTSASVNTYLHASPKRPIEYKLTLAADQLRVEIQNESNESKRGTTSDFGTKDVLFQCLEMLGGRLLSFPAPGARGLCTTLFELPAKNVFMIQEG